MRKAVGEILSIAQDGCIRPMHGGQWIKNSYSDKISGSVRICLGPK